MRKLEPEFHSGMDMINYRFKYIEDWLKKHHPALKCKFVNERPGCYDVWICLNDFISDDSILMSIQDPEDMKDSADVIGKATMMKGVHVFQAPVMCNRIENKIKKTGNYKALKFLDSFVKRTGKHN